MVPLETCKKKQKKLAKDCYNSSHLIVVGRQAGQPFSQALAALPLPLRVALALSTDALLDRNRISDFNSFRRCGCGGGGGIFFLLSGDDGGLIRLRLITVNQKMIHSLSLFYSSWTAWTSL